MTATTLLTDSKRPPRTELAAEVARLYAAGMVGTKIAEKLGLSRAYTYALLSDPDGSKDRERKKRYGTPCVDCGAPTNGSDGHAIRRERCGPCSIQFQHENRRWTLEAVVEAMRRWARAHGRPPAAADWMAAGEDHPAASTVVRDYGWSEALDAAGFPPKPIGHWGAGRRAGENPEEIQRTVDLYLAGLSSRAVGEELGICGATVLYRLEAAGIPRRPANRWHPDHAKAASA